MSDFDNAMQRLKYLKAEVAAMTDEIALIEKGLKMAAYDASMNNQLLTVNDARAKLGKPPLTMVQWASGCY